MPKMGNYCVNEGKISRL